MSTLQQPRVRSRSPGPVIRFYHDKDCKRSVAVEQFPPVDAGSQAAFTVYMRNEGSHDYVEWALTVKGEHCTLADKESLPKHFRVGDVVPFQFTWSPPEDCYEALKVSFTVVGRYIIAPDWD